MHFELFMCFIISHNQKQKNKTIPQLFEKRLLQIQNYWYLKGIIPVAQNSKKEEIFNYLVAAT